MASRFQEAALVGPPLYPNAVAWSQENLLAVASGHLVTILNPDLPSGPRGLITIPNCEPYPVGVVKREDLLTGGLLPKCLNRDHRQCVRSLSWSNIGMASNYGCLLAVCTSEGRVKLYRPPFCDFCSEWIELADISDMLFEYLSSIRFGELDNPPSGMSKEQIVEQGGADDPENIVLKRRRRNGGKINRCNKNSGNEPQSSKNKEGMDDRLTNFSKFAGPEILELEPIKQLKESHQVASKSKARKNIVNKISQTCSTLLISADQYASRDAMLSSLVVAWSPMLRLPSEVFPVASTGLSNCFSLLAVGAKSGA